MRAAAPPRLLRHVGREVGVHVKILSLAGDGLYDLQLVPRGTPHVLVKGRRELLCVHGHAAFIGRLLASYPGAVVETEITTYEGLDDYEARQAEVWAQVVARFGVRCGCPAA